MFQTVADDVVTQYDSTNGARHLLYDGHGSTRQLVDNNEDVKDAFSYDGYGVMLGANPANAATSLLYTGEMYDSSASMYYLRARWYDAAAGRFNRMDPFAGNTQDPQSLHKYLYCHANPVNGIDPTGELLGDLLFSSSNAFSVHIIYDETVQSIGYTLETMIYGTWAGLSENTMIWQATLGVVVIPLVVMGLPRIIGRIFGERAATYAVRFMQVAQFFPLMMVKTGANDHIPKVPPGGNYGPRTKLRQNMLTHCSTQGLDVRAHHLIAWQNKDHEVIRGIHMNMNHESNGIFLWVQHHIGNQREYNHAQWLELERIKRLPYSQWDPEVRRMRNNAAIALYTGAPLWRRHGATVSGWRKIFRARR